MCARTSRRMRTIRVRPARTRCRRARTARVLTGTGQAENAAIRNARAVLFAALCGRISHRSGATSGCERIATHRSVWRSCRQSLPPPKTWRRHQAAAAHVWLLRRQGHVGGPGRVSSPTMPSPTIRPASSSARPASASICSAMWAACRWAGGPGRQPSLQPHEHPAGGAHRSRRHQRPRDAGARWRCSAAWAVAPPGPKASTRCSIGRKAASGRSRGWTTTRDSARPMPRDGSRRSAAAGRCKPLRRHRARADSWHIRRTRNSGIACEGFPAACIAPFTYATRRAPAERAPGPRACAATAVASHARRCGNVGELRQACRPPAPTRPRSRTCSASTASTTIARSGTRWRTCSPTTAPSSSRSRACTSAASACGSSWARSGPHGLVPGWMNDRMQLQVIVDVAPDGRSARARSRELSMTGHFGEGGEWSEGIYENAFVKENGRWKFSSVHFYPDVPVSDYDTGLGQGRAARGGHRSEAAAGPAAHRGLCDLSRRRMCRRSTTAIR